MADKNYLEEFIDSIKQDPVNTNNTYSAVVSKIDSEGAVWVHVAGSEVETPTSLSSSEVSQGDSVTVEWRNNKLYIAGNSSNPSAGVIRVGAVEAATRQVRTLAESAAQDAATAHDAAERAVADADRAYRAAEDAQQSADDALASAQNAQQSADSALVSLSTVEDVVDVLNWITAHGTMTANGSTPLDPSKVYFIRDNNGDYVVGSYHYSIVAEPKAEDRTSYYTLSVDESIQNYVATHVVVDAEGLWLVPDSGGNKVLIATGSGSVYTTAGTYIIGKVNGLDTVFAKFTTDGATMNATNSTQIAHLGYGEGTAQSGRSIAPYYTLGTRRAGSTVGNYSVAEGYNTTASGYISHAEGNSTTASGSYSHAEGGAAGGGGTQLPAPVASGNYSHAEGCYTVASEVYSHAQNLGTIADGIAQTVIGTYNVADNYHILIIGNGQNDTYRSNALTVDSFGNVNIPSGANYQINESNLSASDVGAVPTSRTVNGKALSSNISLTASDVGALSSSAVKDYVTVQSQSSTSYGDGVWRWREWNSGKVEIWYHGSFTLNTDDGVNHGVYRYSRWFNFPNNYSLYRCTCIVNGMENGAWYGCGGLQNASSQAAEPYRKLQVMGYRLNEQPPTAPININIYICGQKSI